MPKKIKRKVSQVGQPVAQGSVAVAERPTNGTASTSAPRAAVYSRPSATRAITAADFNPDYSYVVKDLKRIGVLAGSFFVILIALSFIIK